MIPNLLHGAKMRLFYIMIITAVFPAIAHAGTDTPVSIIAREPVTMMDLGILKLNTNMRRQTYPGLKGATITAVYQAKHGTIDIKVSMPVKKASRAACAGLINDTKKIFLQPYGKKKVSNIHHYFQHEGRDYSRRVNWDTLANYVVITGIVLTGKNYQHSVYCQSGLMSDKISY